MMGRPPSSDENSLKKGPWASEEDRILVDHIRKHGHGSWRALPNLAGLNRCGKSCRLRWTNYLRPDIKRGKFSDEEEQNIINLHAVLGNKWSAIATHLPGRTDNEIKNFWNTHLRKKLLQMGIDPVTHRPRTDNLNILASLQQLFAAANFNNLINNMVQVLGTPLTMEAMNLPLGFAQQHEAQSSEYQQPMKNSNICSNSNDHRFASSSSLSFATTVQTSSSTPSPQQLPSSISASPEHRLISKVVENKSNPNEISNPSSTSTTFEAWGDLMHDEANDSYWRDIIDQASSQSWPIS